MQTNPKAITMPKRVVKATYPLPDFGAGFGLLRAAMEDAPPANERPCATAQRTNNPASPKASQSEADSVVRAMKAAAKAMAKPNGSARMRELNKSRFWSVGRFSPQGCKRVHDFTPSILERTAVAA